MATPLYKIPSAPVYAIGSDFVDTFFRFYIHTDWTQLNSIRVRGPFLESPGNFSGPKSNIQIEI